MTKDNYPCVLLINDIHISKDNIPEFTANWNEAVSICENRGVRHIAMGGDLFQSRSSQTLDVLLAVYDAFVTAEKSGIQITVINGNHDKVNLEDVRGYCHVFNRHSNVVVADDYLTLSEEGWAFALHMIAYFPENGSFRDKLGSFAAGGLHKDKLNYLYIHEGVNGALSQPSEKELPATIFNDFDKVLVGHYHNRIQIPNTSVEYIGSSRQHNFGEDEEKGYTLLYRDGSSEFIKNKVNIRFKTIDVADNKIGIHLNDLLEEIKAKGGYKVRVRIHSNNSESAKNIDKDTLIKSGATKVEIVTSNPEVSGITSTSLFEKFDHQKIQENYQEFCREKNIENVALGLSYLSKINLHYVETN